MRLVILLMSILFISQVIFAQKNSIYSHKAIVLFKLIAGDKDKVYKLSSSFVLINDAKLTLGEGELLISHAKLFLNDAFSKSIIQNAGNYNIVNTKLFREKVDYDSLYHEINYGGLTFQKNSNLNKKVQDTIFISYKLKAKFALIDSMLGRTIHLIKLHCFERGDITYPIIIPLDIKCFSKLRRKDMKKLGLVRSGIGQYFFRDCD